MNLKENQIGVLLSYNTWANRRLTGQIEALSQEEFIHETGGSFPSLRLTLVHLLESEWIWLNRWQGKPLILPPDSWDTTSATSLATIWTGMQEEIERIFEAKSPDIMEQPLRFITKNGIAMEMPYWQTVSHMVNHGTYHRGQLANTIRILGHTPAATDLFLFFNEENQKSGT